jgi:sec-independent protein translocase protein TatA
MGTLEILAFAWQPSIWELLIILVIALLLFGKRLPEVARSLGKGVVEFKKGLKGVEEDVDQSNYSPPRSTYTPPPPSTEGTPTSTETTTTPKS